MTIFLQYLFTGLTLSAMYALVAVSWSLGWSVTHALNLMVGEYVVVGALTFAVLRSDGDWPLVTAALAAVLAAVAAGVATDVLLRVLGAKEHDTVILVTLAMVLMAHETWAAFFGREPTLVAPFVSGDPFIIGGAVVTRQVVLVIVIASVVLLSTGLILHYTRYGRGMRACAEDPYGALWCGISTLRVRTMTIITTAVIGGIAGMILVPLTAFGYQSGASVSLKGLVAAILGGLGSTSGAIFGALAVGVGEAMLAGYVSSEMASGILFFSMIVILLFAPNGLAARLMSLRRGRLITTQTAQA